MSALIFGANGQDGFYLSQLLRQEGIDVVAVSRTPGGIQADVADYAAVESLIKTHRPEYVFHLAARSTTRHDALFENHAAISTGTLNIFESVKKHSPATKVFISGSGLQFRNEGHPIRETDPFDARDAYSVSRIHSVYATRYYRGLGIRGYIGYFFNHDSPRRSEHHMTKMISEAALRIGAGSKETVAIGDIGAIKEWTFAGDVVKGIWTLVQQDSITEANIGSGEGHSIGEWVEACFALAGKDWREYVVKKDGFTPDYRQLVSDSSRIFSLGWRPAVSFQQLARMMMTKP
ncbi:MAG TPA: GDP-mannose 4,6-dehydratase [Chitinophagaceae bacterium]|nr:GDP-mannose 4,6-dehydratase [Chitinophagaceae bacterium]